MANISWYVNRLRAMSVKEVLWRFQQKKLEKAERQTFGKQHIQITDKVFYQGKEDLTFHVEKLPIAPCEGQCVDGAVDNGCADGEKKKLAVNRSIALLGGYDYEKYRKDWHGGFQTENKWPLTFSYDLQYKQKDEVGDARTNWELNRHFQFALLACDYYHTGKIKYLTELSDLFADWNQENPFLYGISWTSVMEVAIRDINWIYTLGFLQRAFAKKNSGRLPEKENGQPTEQEADEEYVTKLCEQLRVGIVNMTTYISSHYSRYSSANNHVIVEAAAMGIAGIVMDCVEWIDMALSILNHEMPRQNYSDGVNKEVSLHYQSFFMEAVGLLMLVMQHDGRNIPMNWRYILQKMSRYVADCQGSYGETVVFGDDDAGKILDLEGIAEKESGGNGKKETHRNHYHYVLQLMSLLLPERYVDKVTDVSLLCLVSKTEIKSTIQKSLYISKGNVCYEDGGVTLIKTRDERVFIGIDHGELGFGSIAAHGHADALSFQMFLEGEPVFADAGTYIYHMDLVNRNVFRKTENHNTVTINGKNQSEMLGAFLWGKRAKTTLLWHNLPVGNAWEEDEKKEHHSICGNTDEGSVFYLEAEHDGYAPVVHKRKFVFNGIELKIYDSLLHVEKELSYGIHFLLGNGVKVQQSENERVDGIRVMTAKGNELLVQTRFSDETLQAGGMKRDELPVPEILTFWISEEYGQKEQTEQLRFNGKTRCDMTIVTTITWENGK